MVVHSKRNMVHREGIGGKYGKIKFTVASE